MYGLMWLMLFLFSSSQLNAQLYQTQILTQSGEARVNESMPFFSGWTLDRKTISLKTILQQNNRGYLLVFGASWSTDTEELLKTIYKSRKTLDDHNISVILLLEDGRTNEQMKAWLKQINLNFATVIVDTYQALAEKFDLKHPNGISTNQALQKKQKQELEHQEKHIQRKKIELIDYQKANPKDLFLNKAIVFDQNAKIKAIFGLEGQDFIEQVIKALRSVSH